MRKSLLLVLALTLAASSPPAHASPLDMGAALGAVASPPALGVLVAPAPIGAVVATPVLADAAPAPVTIDGKSITPAAQPDVTDISGDLAAAKELAAAAQAKDYLLLVALALLFIVGVLKKLAGKVKALAFIDTHLGGLVLNFVCAAAAVAVGADRAGIHFSFGLLEVAGLAGLTAAGGWHAIVDPVLSFLFPAKSPVVGAPVAVK